jgi:hypothetical protein
MTADQRSTLAALPTDITSVRELLAAHRTATHAFMPTARRVAAQLDVPWPTALEAAATRHLESVLGIVHPYGC